MMEFEDKKHDLKDAIIYGRISSRAQAQRGQGLDSQVRYCRQYAERKGYNVVATFQDKSISGSRADREGIMDMLAFLRENKRKQRYVVLVDDVSRLARDVRVHWDLRDAIDAYGAVLESPAMVFGSSADERFMENMQAMGAQHQREKNAEQTTKRMQGRALGGYYPFSAPLGYAQEKQPGHGNVLVPKEPIASIIREALTQFASGHMQTQAEVKRFLQNQPDFPKNRFGLVTDEAANRILTRVVYSGYVEVAKWGISLRPGHHEGLVDLETFERAQERLKGNNTKAATRADISEDFPLRGFVNCGDCGNPLTANWSTSKTGKKHAYYICFNKSCCSYRKSIRRDDVEGAFETVLAHIQPSTRLIGLAKAMFKKAWDMKRTAVEGKKEALKKQLSETDTQLARLLDRIVGAESASVIKAYEGRITKLEKERLIIEEKLAKKAPKQGAFNQLFELALGFLTNPKNMWDNGTLAHKRTVLNMTFEEKLVYSRNKGLRTPKTSIVFKALEDFCGSNKGMAVVSVRREIVSVSQKVGISHAAVCASRRHSERASDRWALKVGGLLRCLSPLKWL